MPPHFRSNRAAAAFATTLALLVPAAPAAARVGLYGGGATKPGNPIVLAHAARTPARAGVYGGATKAGDPIVLMTNAQGTKVTSVGFRVRVDGTDDEWWPLAGTARVVAPPTDPGTVHVGVLVAQTNAGGHFDAQVVSGGTNGVMAGVHLKGTLKPTKATGTIEGWVTVTDTSTGILVQDARTPAIKWTAARSAGRVFAGATTDSLPVVVTLNATRRKVSEIRFSCFATDTVPVGMFWSASVRLINFPITAGRFGDAWDDTEDYADGGRELWHYDISGRVTSKAVKGSLAMSSTGSTADGWTYGFRMPPTRFTATTG